MGRHGLFSLETVLMIIDPVLVFRTCSGAVVKKGRMGLSVLATVLVFGLLLCHGGGALSFKVKYDEHQPLSRVALHNARVLLDDSVSISASPQLLGQKVTTSYRDLE